MLFLSFGVESNQLTANRSFMNLQLDGVGIVVPLDGNRRFTAVDAIESRRSQINFF